MKTKRIAFIAVLVLAVAAVAVPLVGLRARAAASGSASSKATAPNPKAAVAGATTEAASTAVQSQETRGRGRIDSEILRKLGHTKMPAGTDMAKVSKMIANRIRGGAGRAGVEITPQAGEPATIMNSQSALSAALIVTIGGRDNQFSEVALLADWDGREDCVADRAQKIDDFSFSELEIDFVLTRAAISEHTFANGFTENVLYYGDSVGNFWIGTDTNPGTNPTGASVVDTIQQINIPELVNTTTSGGVILLNPIAGDCTDDQVTVTGIAVNPVSDLGDFGLCGTIGEVVYVSTHDSEGCASNGANQPFRTRIFAFGFTDTATGVTPVGAIQIVRNSLSNIAGVAVDGDSNLYFQLIDLIGLSGGAIFKATETPRVICAINGGGIAPQGGPGAIGINRVIASVPAGLTGGIGLASAQGTGASPILVAAGYRLTNYSGPSTTFGNIVAISSGPCNVLYAALARSQVGTDDGATRATEGLFTNPSALGATPSMIISFADCAGGFDSCTAPAVGILGTLPVADGLSDVAQAGITRVAGVNNFRVFVLGNGPDIRPPTGGTAVVPGTPSTLLKIDMQIDYQSHSGLAVNEEGTVFVISGGAPGGPGTNPSPSLGEILCFEDSCAADRRADFVDLRGNGLPNPPASGGNVGDGDSDRFDHIFFVSPIDQVTLTPGGLSGLARGFLLYTNRLRNRNVGTLANLPNGGTQGDDATSGVLIFEDFDAGHQVAGGDDQNTPFRGDDDNGAGSPALVGPLSGGFEFVFGGPVGTAGCVWNGLFLNSNGNVTFGIGSTANVPTVPNFRTGPPRIAAAWTDINPNARAVNPNNFPVQALGFANVNAFEIGYLNVPQFGNEGCSTNAFGIGGNTFSTTLYDDGTGIDENANQPLNPANPIGNNAVPFDLNEGPTDVRFTVEPTTGSIIGCSTRPNGSGHFIFDYCRMDLLGTEVQPVLVGYSIGGLSALNPPGLCETNLSEAARAADTGPFGVIQGQTASIMPCLIGEGTEPTIFELFNEGSGPRLGSGGEIAFATPDFDLRFEGNDPALCTPIRQRDLNRGRVGFFGIGCEPPANPICLGVTPVGTVAVAPGQPAVGTAAAGTPGTGPNGTRAASPTAGIINAICSVQLNVLGCGFYPNETTIVCQGFSNETGVPLQRPGKTVTSALSLVCDTNVDGIADVVIPLSAVTPINKNLVRGTLGALGAVGLPGTAFPLTCCGGLASLQLTTTFTAGDNNVFGPFTRTTVCTIDLGLRAPVVISVTPSEGDCAVAQDLLISGACFIINGLPNVTSVFAVELGNPNNVIQATRFVILNANLVDALFNFGSVNAGKTFLIFASGPNGTSQNLTTLPVGAAGCPLGNQQGIQAFFRCRTGTPGGGGGAANIAVLESCSISRSAGGKLSVEVRGRNFLPEATMLIGGQSPKKLKFKGEVQTGSNISFTRLIASGKVKCSHLSGDITVTNVGAPASAPFRCTAACQ